MAEKVGAAKFGLWFGEDVRLGVEGDSLEVGVPTGFFREWIKGHFAGSLIEAAEAVVGRPLKLAFKVEGEPGQIMAVSHGTAPARFRDVQVGVA